MSLESLTPDQIAALAELSQRMASNPETRGAFLKLTKQVNPETHIPEVDIPAAMEHRFAPMQDKLTKLEAEIARRDAEESVRAKRKEARKVAGVTADDIPAIEKLMVERGIADHKTAAEFYVMQNRAGEPTASAGSQAIRTFGAPKAPDLKEFGGSLSAFARKNAFDMIDQLRGRRTA